MAADSSLREAAARLKTSLEDHTILERLPPDCRANIERLDAEFEGLGDKQVALLPRFFEALRLALEGGETTKFLMVGEAGAGKSHLLRWIHEWCAAWGFIVMVAASSAVAGTHINGSTIQSALGIRGTHEQTMASWAMPDGNRFRPGGGEHRVRVLTVDEMSMVDNVLYDTIATLIEKYAEGMVVFFTADFRQLPPPTDNVHCFLSKKWNADPPIALVLEGNQRQRDDPLLYRLLAAVASGAVGSFLDRVQEGTSDMPDDERLKAIVEEELDDPPPLGATAQEREDHEAMRAMALINSRFFPDGAPADVHADYIMPKNSEVDAHNSVRLAALPGAEVVLPVWAQLERRFRRPGAPADDVESSVAPSIRLEDAPDMWLPPPWGQNMSIVGQLRGHQQKMRQIFRAPRLKVGAEVKCTYNVSPRVFNSLRGHVVRFEPLRLVRVHGKQKFKTASEEAAEEAAEDDLYDGARPKKEAAFEVQCPVICWRSEQHGPFEEVFQPFMFRATAPAQDGNGTLTVHVMGWPLTVSWAVTVHAVQGLTIHKPLEVAFKREGFAIEQMFYVIASRLTRLRDLFIRSLDPKVLRMNPTTLRFLRSLRTGQPARYEHKAPARRRPRSGEDAEDEDGSEGGRKSGGRVDATLFVLASQKADKRMVVTKIDEFVAKHRAKLRVTGIVAMAGSYYESQDWVRDWADAHDVFVENIGMGSGAIRDELEARERKIMQAATHFLFIDPDGDTLPKRMAGAPAARNKKTIWFLYKKALTAFGGEVVKVVAAPGAPSPSPSGHASYASSSSSRVNGGRGYY